MIAGDVYGSASYLRAHDGFLLDLNPSNGNVNFFNSYGDYTYSSMGCNWFSCLTPAFSNYGGSVGYVMGGYHDVDPIPGNDFGYCWIIKVDVNGNIIWNKRIQGATDYGHNIVDVIERNNMSGQYEYYALASTNTPSIGSLVFKLDHSGTPYSFNNLVNDEFFYYNSGSLNPVNISFINNGPPNDVGIQIYANGSPDYYLVEAYFNGASGCYESFSSLTNTYTSNNFVQPWINKWGSFVKCTSLTASWINLSLTSVTTCSSNLIFSGNNNKLTTMSSNQIMPSSPEIFPNPIEENLIIKVSKKAEINIFNSLGELLFIEKLDIKENLIDFTGKPAGVYLLKLIQDEKTSIYKLIKK